MRRWRHLGQRFGRGGRGGVKVGAYLIRDEFLSEKSSGGVDGTPCEPGPGMRLVASDTGGYESIAGGEIVVTNSVNAGDPGIWLSPQILRQVGKIASATVTPSALSAHFGIGWDVNLIGNVQNRLAFGGSGALIAVDAAGRTVGAYANGTQYMVAVILRGGGQFYFIKGGIYSHWTLLWISYDDVVKGVYPAVTPNQAGAAYKCSRMVVPSFRWLPAALISDGFSAFESSDGLGHAEGISGGIGSGGAGVAWGNTVGTWQTAGTCQAATLAGGLAIRTADVGKADMIVNCDITRAGGTAGIIVRWVDANNHIQLRHTGTNVQLVKVVAGVSTTVADAAATYVANAPARVICEGTKFRAFYNNVAYGGEQTISDAALQASTVVGLRTSDTGNAFDNFVAYARGTAGEYNAVLDAV